MDRGFGPNKSEDLVQISQRIWSKYFKGFGPNMSKDLVQIYQRIWSKFVRGFDKKNHQMGDIFRGFGGYFVREFVRNMSEEFKKKT